MSGDTAPPHVVEDCLGIVQLLSDGTVVRPDAAQLLPPTTFFPDVPGVEWEDVAFDAPRGLKLRMYRPPVGADKLPVLVYFHGGGFCAGSFDHPHIHASCLRLAAELPAVVLSADYRLAPEHRLPAAIDDGAAVLAWLRGHAQAADPWLAESADFTRVFVAGESAGGNLAHHVAVRVVGSEAALAGAAATLHVAGSILITPFFGGAERTGTESEPSRAGVLFTIEMSDQFWRLSLPGGATRDHPAANPFGPGSPSLAPVALPPVLVVAAGRDVLRDRVVGYAESLRGMGKAVELAVFDAEEHGFSVVQPWGDAATEMIRVVKRFVWEGARSN
ncbi:hypothetical protein HU200_053044 [Digitaria exilis]|uniref:Alpha/beta hydrolase fold-3 domain-containing protein n=1 Tax=Digitaria exilis TaxID=1010633 RepID=A0A835AN23_9POAL|nr:hypothetical protein HU200_053044 [Digitaria exilis]CAB3484457.1 unnamed protein product [Digitaria exilis]